MRIVAGRFRGRALKSPEDRDVRPTSDRVRESLFNILEHGVPEFSLHGARVIDLFAGTGALGLEAISRGASYCLFVDDAAKSRAIIRDNVEAFGLTGETRIFRRDATDLGPIGTMAPFAIAFIDPPYGKDLAAPAISALIDGGWLTDTAIIVVEEHAEAVIACPTGFQEHDVRRYGDTQVAIFIAAGTATI